jgi:hypothetical protein
LFKSDPERYKQKIGPLNEPLRFDIFTCFNLLHFPEINRIKVLENIKLSLKNDGLGLLSFAFFNNYKNNRYKKTSDDEYKKNIECSFFVLKKKLTECPNIKNEEDFLSELPGNKEIINNFLSVLTINQIRDKQTLTSEEIDKILCNEYNNTAFKLEKIEPCFKSFCENNPSINISGEFILEGFCPKENTFIFKADFYNYKSFYEALKKTANEIKNKKYYSGDAIIFIKNKTKEEIENDKILDEILDEISNLKPVFID